MVCNYQKKSNKKRTYGYCSNGDLQKAINAVKSKQMTLRKASGAFNGKKSTLHDHVKGKHNKKPGIFFLLFSKTEGRKFHSLDTYTQ